MSHDDVIEDAPEKIVAEKTNQVRELVEDACYPHLYFVRLNRSFVCMLYHSLESFVYMIKYSAFLNFSLVSINTISVYSE